MGDVTTSSAALRPAQTGDADRPTQKDVESVLAEQQRLEEALQRVQAENGRLAALVQDLAPRYEGTAGRQNDLQTRLAAVEAELWLKKNSVPTPEDMSSLSPDLLQMAIPCNDQSNGDSQTEDNGSTAARDLEGPGRAFVITLIVLEVITLAFYAGMVTMVKDDESGAAGISRYTWFQNVHVMIFVGFGFLMTFLRKYALSAVSVNMLLAALCLQLHLPIKAIFEAMFFGHGLHAELDMKALIQGDFCAGSILISFGAVIGKTSPLQMVILSMLEVIGYTLNEVISEKLVIVDDGGSMVIHLYGAVFGLAASYVMSSKDAKASPNEGSAYANDIFSMIGTIFLWMYWPSFNGALVASPAQQSNAAALTLVSLTASCVTTFALSSLLRKRLSMVDIQNATLAGGVGIGSICAVIGLPAYAAVIVGCGTGAVSTFGFSRLQRFLLNRVGLHDSCGVLNLHGMPGLVGGIASVFAVGFLGSDGAKGAGMQVAFIVITFFSSLVWGAVCGLVAKMAFWNPTRKSFFDDELYIHLD